MRNIEHEKYWVWILAVKTLGVIHLEIMRDIIFTES